MRDRILDATATLLVTQGTEASMARIAARAGVATGSLYNHFESKDALIRAVYARLGEAVNAHLVGECTEATSARDRLTEYIGSYIDFIWSDPERAILFEYLSNVPLLPSDEMSAVFARSSVYIVDLLEALQEEGVIARYDAAMMAGFVGGAIRNALKWQRVRGGALTERDRTEISAMCLMALGACRD